ncbi:MAG: hypothetical protein WC876_02850 [Candidatus Thermoplasmatota archaeon]|jgi:hypothetical protein
MAVRKATWGAILLGVFALTLGSPIRDIPALHRVLGLASLGGYLLVSYDPPVAGPLQRKLVLAGVGAAVVTFLLAFAPLPTVVSPFIRVLAVATVALPVWLVARPPQFAFVAAAALALATAIPVLSNAGGYATSTHAYVAAAGAFWMAWAIHTPWAIPGQARKPPRRVVASNIVTLSPAEKTAALARIEKRYRDGEIPEHKYWDLRQEIESR